jgi:hypothetical protein
MKATRFDADMIADSISDMIYDYIQKRQLSVDKCIELYDEIMYILEKFDDDNGDDIIYYDQFDDAVENELLAYYV